MILTRRLALSAGLALALFGAAAPRPAAAVDPTEAEAFVRDLVSRMIEIVKTADSTNTRVDEVMRLIEESTAIEDIARFTMGPNWRRMSEAQQREFLDAFERYAARVYVNRLGDYDGQTVEITGAKDVGRKGVLVTSVLRSPGSDPINLEWLVNDRNGPIQLVDLVAEGVSLSISQREEFAAMVEKRGGDIDAFIDDLDTLG